MNLRLNISGELFRSLAWRALLMKTSNRGGRTMMGQAWFVFLVSLCSVSGMAWAESLNPHATLRFENSPFKDSPLYCEERHDIVPAKNEFELLNYVLMSSDYGERYALVTLRNRSGGQRIFTQDHVVAILGDCQRLRPLPVEKRFASTETLTLRLNFGISKFPILKLINRKL